jgi:hypothetical protein
MEAKCPTLMIISSDLLCVATNNNLAASQRQYSLLLIIYFVNAQKSLNLTTCCRCWLPLAATMGWLMKQILVVNRHYHYSTIFVTIKQILVVSRHYHYSLDL